MTKRLGILLVLVSAACAGKGEFIPSPSPAPEPTSTTELITSTVLAAPETTTTTDTEPEPATTTEVVATTRARPVTTTTEYLREQATTPPVAGNCGGALPPCYVMERESRGDPTVYNYSGSGASGKWQVMPSTWNNYAGYANAADAPESVQDQFARMLWDNGNGCYHWDAC